MSSQEECIRVSPIALIWSKVSFNTWWAILRKYRNWETLLICLWCLCSILMVLFWAILVHQLLAKISIDSLSIPSLNFILNANNWNYLSPGWSNQVKLYSILIFMGILDAKILFSMVPTINCSILSTINVDFFLS